MKSTGIVLIACGHPYYGKYAYQLAMSIKWGAPGVPITLLCDNAGKQHLSDFVVFDSIIDVPEKYTYFRGRKNYIKPKVYLNHFTPYDRTLFLDVDMIWNPKRSILDLLNELKGNSFTMQNRGHIDLSNATGLDSHFMIWSKSIDIKTAHELKSGKLYNLSSELIYFEKSKKVDDFFATAQALFESPKVQYIDFADGVPDELPFSISMIKHKMYPHVDNWRPVFWEPFDKKQPVERELWANYHALSLGGNIVPKYTKRIYDNLLTFFGNQMNIATTFRVATDKNKFIDSRKTI